VNHLRWQMIYCPGLPVIRIDVFLLDRMRNLPVTHPWCQLHCLINNVLRIKKNGTKDDFYLLSRVVTSTGFKPVTF
jgi:hypothetical protein